MKEAAYWVPENGRARCELCPHRCLIADGHTGRCRVRVADGGRLYAWGYGRVSSAHLDPMEKKPLHHFFPGSMIYSVGGWGCNFRCRFCQNWTISQQAPDAAVSASPASVIASAAACGSIGVAYTYNEPLVGLEFVMECARLARKDGLKNVLVTNGYIQPGPASDILGFTDALNIDIKSVRDKFYADLCGASVQPVLDFAVQAKRAGCHVEITNLVIPGLNDADDEIDDLAEWVSHNLGPFTPLHLSAYFPQYQLDAPATGADALAGARSRCLPLLRYVYVGNVRPSEGQDTTCPGCGNVLVERRGYAVSILGLNGTRCRECGRNTEIIVE